MNIGIYQEPLHTKDHISYDTYGAFARCLSELCRQFSQVTVFAPIARGETYFSGIPLTQSNMQIVPLPFFETHAQAYCHAPAIARALISHASCLDAAIVRATAPMGYLLRLFMRRSAPFVYHFASDPMEILRTSPRYRGWKGALARTAYRAELMIQHTILRRNYGFASGQALCRRLRRISSNVLGITTSALSEEDFHQREDTCCGSEIRLLFVGRLRFEKHADDLIRAMVLLRREGRPIVAEIVGDGEAADSLRAVVQREGLLPHVTFPGHVKMGATLNQRYRASDIFVFPSGSEGSPKVVLEAMANSMPVVATNVGDIPAMLGHGRRGVLVLPGDPNAIAEGIARLIDQKAFRQHCIRQGYDYARQHTTRTYVAQMAETVKDLARQRGKAKR